MQYFLFSIFILGSLWTRLWAIELFCQSEEFKRAHIGFCIIDVKTGKDLYVQNAEQFFNPASLQKIPLSMVALSVLGANYKFTTELEYEGKIDDQGVLQGNIWIRGAGDPSLSLQIFAEWEDAIRKAGIKRIDGQILVDSSCFETTLASPFWEFQDLGNYYGAGASALAINNNTYKITFQPGMKEGDPAQVLKTEPAMPHLLVHNEVLTGPPGSGDQVYVYGTEYSPIQFYRGIVPLDQPIFIVRASIPNPPLFCANNLSEKIPTSCGVEIRKKKTNSTCNKVTLHTNESPSLCTLITEMNHHSVNLYAEHLLKTIGQGRSEQGAQMMQQFLQKLCIPSVIRDGSGLSRRNLITPRGFASLLCQIRNSPVYRPIYESFPEVGKETRYGFLQPLQSAVVKAKTGSMTGIGNLGGYLILPSGKEYAFCLFCNNYDGSLANIHAETFRFIKDLLIELEGHIQSKAYD